MLGSARRSSAYVKALRRTSRPFASYNFQGFEGRERLSLRDLPAGCNRSVADGKECGNIESDRTGTERDKQPRGVLVGVTGGIACGKSEVGRVLTGYGVAVRDADLIAHETMAPGGPAYDEVVTRFGREIVNADGTINRGLLGKRVFARSAELEALNKIVHPHVRHIWRAWARVVRERHQNGAIIIPLLFEVGAETDMDAVICVTATDDRIMERLIRRGLTEEQARLRIAAQMPLNEKMRRADYVIENNQTLEALQAKTLHTWQAILNKERDTHG